MLKVLIIINDLLYVFDLFYESLYKSMSFPLSGELLAGGRAGVGAGGREVRGGGDIDAGGRDG